MTFTSASVLAAATCAHSSRTRSSRLDGGIATGHWRMNGTSENMTRHDRAHQYSFCCMGCRLPPASQAALLKQRRGDEIMRLGGGFVVSAGGDPRVGTKRQQADQIF